MNDTVKTPNVRTGFMCAVDFRYELGNSSGPNMIYSSLEELKEKRTCVAECGIVEVEVTVINSIPGNRARK